jgi:hypothetical protein
MKFSKESNELIKLLQEDQEEWKAYAAAKQTSGLSIKQQQKHKEQLRHTTTRRGKRALEIFQIISGVPSIKNIGTEAAIALSVLATHYSLAATKHVLAAFEAAAQQPNNGSLMSSIPAMVDWIAVLEQRPQTFGTIWLFDNNKYPFLPEVDDFEHVNERRDSYGIEPLRWPKSLAIPEDNQPWLKRPISEAVMRSPTKVELQELSEDYL